MGIAFGSGHTQIVIYNADKRYEVDLMLSRIAAAYQAMLTVGYPSVTRAEHSCILIFSSCKHVCAALNLSISSRPYGIYVDECAYHKQLAQVIHRETGFEIHPTNTVDADLEIGIGGLDASTQGFVILKDALLGLADILTPRQ